VVPHHGADGVDALVGLEQIDGGDGVVEVVRPVHDLAGHGFADVEVQAAFVEVRVDVRGVVDDRPAEQHEVERDRAVVGDEQVAQRQKGLDVVGALQGHDAVAVAGVWRVQGIGVRFEQQDAAAAPDRGGQVPEEHAVAAAHELAV